MKNSEVTHRRLHNQGLSNIIFKDAVDAVTQLGAVQAQDYSGAKWALGQRLNDSSDSELDQAFANGSILRTHLLRPTWHFVTPQDIRWLLMLTAPRVHAASAYIYRQSGIDKATFGKSNRILEKTLQGGKQLTRKELAIALDEAGIPAKGFRLGYLMMYAELEGVICSGARRGKQFTYALLDERASMIKTMKCDEALAELTRRYFATRGPATLQDFTWWSGLTMADANKGIEMVKSEFVSEEINGRMNWFTDSRPLAKKKTPTAHLLPNYDEYFIGFKDRSAIGEVAEQAGFDGNDPSFLAHIIILDGQVIGGWRRRLNKDSVIVEIDLIIKPTKLEDQAIRDAAERFGIFIERSVELILRESNHEQRKTRSV